jgi:hypothetical protein
MGNEIRTVLEALANSRIPQIALGLFGGVLLFAVVTGGIQNVYRWTETRPPSIIASIDVWKLGMVTGTAGTATAFLITLYVTERNYRRSRGHIPNLSMDLRVERVPVSEKYDLVMVTLRATNTGTGLCRIGHVDWGVKALSPYDDEAVEEMLKEYKPETDTPAAEEGTTDPQAIEFPWHEIEQETSSFPISIEPNETEELTQDFLIPAEITAIVASAWVDNVSDPKMTEGWYRRTAHSLKETGHYEPEEVGPAATGPGESQD